MCKNVYLFSILSTIFWLPIMDGDRNVSCSFFITTPHLLFIPTYFSNIAIEVRSMSSISISLYYYYHYKAYLFTIIRGKCPLSLFCVGSLVSCPPPKMSPFLVYSLIMGDQTYNNILKKDTYGIMEGVLT